MAGKHFKTEKYFLKKGFDFVVGIDEAGRGPLAGPVVAAATVLRNLQSISKEQISKFQKNIDLISPL